MRCAVCGCRCRDIVTARGQSMERIAGLLRIPRLFFELRARDEFAFRDFLDRMREPAKPQPGRDRPCPFCREGKVRRDSETSLPIDAVIRACGIAWSLSDAAAHGKAGLLHWFVDGQGPEALEDDEPPVYARARTEGVSEAAWAATS